jgi:hypothetical protein
MVLKMNTDGVASLPALTDTPNVVREANIAGFTVTTGGVINITVGRVFCRPGIVMPDPDTLEWDGLNQLTIADEGVTAAMAGAGVPTMTERQGGGAVAEDTWLTPGTTNFSVGNVKMTAGVGTATLLSGANSVNVAITLPVTFAYPPIIYITPYDYPDLGASLSRLPLIVYAATTTETTASFTFLTKDGVNATANIDVNFSWLVLGAS